jgi:hypothetical protein
VNRVLGPVRAIVDLTDAPEDVLRWLAENDLN